MSLCVPFRKTELLLYSTQNTVRTLYCNLLLSWFKQCSLAFFVLKCRPHAGKCWRLEHRSGFRYLPRKSVFISKALYQAKKKKVGGRSLKLFEVDLRVQNVKWDRWKKKLNKGYRSGEERYKVLIQRTKETIKYRKPKSKGTIQKTNSGDNGKGYWKEGEQLRCLPLYKEN